MEANREIVFGHLRVDGLIEDNKKIINTLSRKIKEVAQNMNCELREIFIDECPANLEKKPRLEALRSAVIGVNVRWRMSLIRTKRDKDSPILPKVRCIIIPDYDMFSDEFWVIRKIISSYEASKVTIVAINRPGFDYNNPDDVKRLQRFLAKKYRSQREAYQAKNCQQAPNMFEVYDPCSNHGYR